MAEKKSLATYESVMRDLKAQKYAPVYILMGDESYYVDKIADYIADNVLEPDDRDFNQTIIFGADTTAAQIADLCRGYPVMPSPYRVVIVKEAQNLKSLDALERYFEKPLSSTILVICYKNGTIDKRKKVVGKAQAVGVVFESKKKRDYELPAFIETYLKSKHVAIDPKSCSKICATVVLREPTTRRVMALVSCSRFHMSLFFFRVSQYQKKVNMVRVLSSCQKTRRNSRKSSLS